MKINPKHYIGAAIAAAIASASFVIMIFENGQHVLVKSIVAVGFAAIAAILTARGIARLRSRRTAEPPP